MDNKYSVDMLLKVGIFSAILILAFDISLVFQDKIMQYEFLHSFYKKIEFQLPQFYGSSWQRKIVVFILFAFSGYGIQVKKKPTDKDNDIVVLSIMFFSVMMSMLSAQIISDGIIYAIVNIVAFMSYVVTYFLLRKTFFYFGRKDQFNEKNQEFDQTKDKMLNEYSVNLETDKGWVNVVNPFRGSIVMGTPGSGKTFSIIEEFMRQQMKKEFAFLVYDFKFPSLAKETYNFHMDSGSKNDFKIINFDLLEYSDFVNPIAANLMRRTSDAIEASQTVLYNLNKEWIEKKDFFAQSAISYFAACIYYLKLYEGGKFCTLPHAIALASQTDEKVFKVLSMEKELDFFLTPFKDALEKQAYEQLSGQTASARIPLSQIATKELFWVMGNNVYPEMNVDININMKDKPVTLILGNDPRTQVSNSPALGLIITQLMKLINIHDRAPSTLVIDELPTIYFMGLDNLMATARSNKVCTVLGFQDMEQLKRDYGDKVAATIFNIAGNVFSGAVRANTAKELQEMFGKTKHKLKNVSMETQTTSTSINESFEYVLPQSSISQLSQGEFVGILADNFGEEIDRKVFRGKIKVPQVRFTMKKYELPKNDKLPDNLDELVDANFKRIVEEIDIILSNELAKQEEQEPAPAAEEEGATDAEPAAEQMAGNENPNPAQTDTSGIDVMSVPEKEE